MGQQFYNEFGAGKLNGVDFQGVPTYVAQGAGDEFRRLDAARATMEQTKAKGQDADAEYDSGELDLSK